MCVEIHAAYDDSSFGHFQVAFLDRQNVGGRIWCICFYEPQYGLAHRIKRQFENECLSISKANLRLRIVGRPIAYRKSSSATGDVRNKRLHLWTIHDMARMGVMDGTPSHPDSSHHLREYDHLFDGRIFLYRVYGRDAANASSDLLGSDVTVFAISNAALMAHVVRGLLD